MYSDEFPEDKYVYQYTDSFGRHWYVSREWPKVYVDIEYLKCKDNE